MVRFIADDPHRWPVDRAHVRPTCGEVGPKSQSEPDEDDVDDDVVGDAGLSDLGAEEALLELSEPLLAADSDDPDEAALDFSLLVPPVEDDLSRLSVR